VNVPPSAVARPPSRTVGAALVALTRERMIDLGAAALPG
jgi:hypothetical protein